MDGIRGRAGWKGWGLCSGRPSWDDFDARLAKPITHFREAGVCNVRKLPIEPIECAVMVKRVIRRPVTVNVSFVGGHETETVATLHQAGRDLSRCLFVRADLWLWTRRTGADATSHGHPAGD